MEPRTAVGEIRVVAAADAIRLSEPRHDPQRPGERPARESGTGRGHVNGGIRQRRVVELGEISVPVRDPDQAAGRSRSMQTKTPVAGGVGEIRKSVSVRIEHDWRAELDGDGLAGGHTGINRRVRCTAVGPSAGDGGIEDVDATVGIPVEDQRGTVGRRRHCGRHCVGEPDVFGTARTSRVVQKPGDAVARRGRHNHVRQSVTVEVTDLWSEIGGEHAARHQRVPARGKRVPFAAPDRT